MPAAIDRNQMADDVIALIVGALVGTYPNLGPLDAQHVKYGIRQTEILSFECLDKLIGIRVDIGDSAVPFHSHAAGQQDLRQKIGIVLISEGIDPVTNRQLAVTASEEVELLMYNNKRLAGGGVLIDHPVHSVHGLGRRSGGSPFQHMVYMEFLYQFIGNFGVP